MSWLEFIVYAVCFIGGVVVGWRGMAAYLRTKSSKGT